MSRRLAAALLLFLPATICSATCPPQFGTLVRPGLLSIALGDFNGDGIPDVVAVAQESTFPVTSSLTILLGQVDGSFPSQRVFPVGQVAARNFGLGDFNGDGKLDVVVASGISSGELTFLMGNGDGTFAAPSSAGSLGSMPTGLTVGDFDGDGILDLAIDEGGAGEIHLGNGNGTFQQPGSAAYGGPALAVADFNGDTILDIVSSRWMYLGNGDGSFQPAIALPTLPTVPYQLVFGDFDADGVLDLIALSSGLSFLHGNGDGTFASGIAVTAPAYPYAAVGDFNNDGALDVVVASVYGFTPIIDVLLGNGDGTFQLSVAQTAVGNLPIQVVVGDTNADGKQDLVVLGELGLFVVRGNGDGTFAGKDYGVDFTQNASAVSEVDLDGDGNVDLVAQSDYGFVSVARGNGDGTFQAVTAYSVPNVRGPVATGHLDADGLLDVAVTTTTSIAVLRGTGAGGLAAPILSDVGGYPTSFAVATFDADGIPDIVVGRDPNGGIGDVAFMKGNGDGSFQAPVTIQSTSYSPVVVTADLNSDGKADLVVGDSFGNFHVLLGSGNGTFVPGANVPTGHFDVISIAVADLNGDGQQDLLVLSQEGTMMQAPVLDVFLGTGGGTFGPETEYNFNSYRGRSLTVTDVNGDGILDVVADVPSFGSPGVAILLGNGDGTLQAPLFVGPPEPFGSPGDVNNDGRPDLAFVLEGSSFVEILLNTTGVQSLLPTILNDGTLGIAYDQRLSPRGGVGPFTFSIATGALPGGLTLSSSGNITGTPTATGPFSFSVSVTDSNGCSRVQGFSLTINAGDSVPVLISVSPPCLPPGQTAVALRIVGTGFVNDSVVSASGTPLTILSSSPTEMVATLPAAMRSVSGQLAITVTNSGPGGGISNSLTLSVEQLSLSPLLLPSGEVGMAYSQAITASGGSGPYSYLVTSGQLPAGLTLDAAGLLSGNPTVGGHFNFSVRATEAGGCGVTHAYSIFVIAVGPPVQYYTIVPCRIVDTRRPAGPWGGPALAGNGATRDFALAASCGVPDDAQAVAVNLTVVNPTGAGDLRIYPTGVSSLSVSSINFRANRTRANNAVLSVAGFPPGSVTLQCDIPGGSSNFLVDVVGYFK